MFQKILRRFLRSKHGLLVLFLFSVTIAFLLGGWWNRGDNSSSFIRTSEVTEEERSWLEEGLLIRDGVYFVGSEIMPGIYRTKGSDMSLYGCNWQRLSGFDAENNNVIVNYYDDSGLPSIVKIAPTDKGFKTQGCGKWYAESIPIVNDPTIFGDGAFIVGSDISLGTYKSTAQGGCYWERLNGLSRNFYSGRLFGRDKELIARGNSIIIEIATADKGFISRGCEQWIRQTS